MKGSIVRLRWHPSYQTLNGDEKARIWQTLQFLNQALL
jgi:hypothetical protein